MKRLKNILSIAAVVLFLSYYASATMFSHTHEFQWGRVTHSHPYMPNSAHSHSAFACSMIEQFTTALFIILSLKLTIALFGSVYHYGVAIVCRIYLRLLLLCDLRAPPCLFSF